MRGGHETTKTKSDEHGEKYIKISKQPKSAKGKGKGKSSKSMPKEVEKVSYQGSCHAETGGPTVPE